MNRESSAPLRNSKRNKKKKMLGCKGRQGMGSEKRGSPAAAHRQARPPRTRVRLQVGLSRLQKPLELRP